MVEDGRAILLTHVGSLAVELGGIVGGEENIEQGLVGDLFGIVEHLNGLGVFGAAVAHLLVGGVFFFASGVAAYYVDYALDPFERGFGTPETAAGKGSFCDGCRERTAGFVDVDGLYAIFLTPGVRLLRIAGCKNQKCGQYG